MRRIYLVALFFITALSVNAQLTGTKNIPGDYATITAAVTDLNTQGVGAGGVTFNIAAGYTETLTGKLTVTATGTAADPIVFQKNGAGANPILTSYTGTVATPSTIADGFFVLAGSDYVTIDGLDLQEAAANTTTTTVMEFGYGLFKASVTNGCQNNTIKNCTITLNRVQNDAWTAPGHNGSIGIAIMNGLHNATGVVTPTAASGSNSFNKCYSNTIQNCNAGIALNGFAATAGVGPAPDPSTFLGDLNNDIGGASAATGNTILNFGGAPAAAQPANGIFASQEWSMNCSYNTVNSNNGSGVNHVNILRGIFLNSSSTSASVTCNNNTITVKGGGTTTALTAIECSFGATPAGNTININNNTITGCTYTTATSGAFTGITNTANPATLNINGNQVTSNATNATSGTTNIIQNTGSATVAVNMNNNNINGFTFNAVTSGALNVITNTAATSTAAVSVSSNNIQGITHTAAGSSTHIYITSTGTPLTNTISNNTFTNLNVNTTGSVTFIGHSYSMPAGGSQTINNNSIVTAFNKPGAGGTVTCTTSGASSPNGTTSSTTNNNFSNITVTGATTIQGTLSNDGSGTSPAKIFTGNTYSNWTGGTSSITGVTYNYLGATISSISNNTFNNITGQGAVTVISIGATFNGATPLNVSSNTVTNISSTGTGGAVIGITCSNTSTPVNINNNTISALSSTGAVAVSGLVVGGASTTNVFKNTICNISGSNASSTVNGIQVSAGTTVNVYNNRVADLRTPAANAANPLIGLSITGGTTVNAYYNTINISGTSTGALFGSSAVSVSTTPTVTLRNNIFVNTSTVNGAAFTAAYRRSTTTLTSYASASDNNLFYAGTPSATNVIYYDGTASQQTLSAYKALVSTRDAFSVTENPPFLSVACGNPNFLKINTTLATQAESGGTSVAGITDDFEGDTRNATTPDIGADEFTGIFSDITPPVISYTPLLAGCGAGAQTLVASISDHVLTGVPTSGIGLPVLYYKINAGAYTASTGTYISGTNYSFSVGAGAAVGDLVSYYIVAQDNAGTPNIGAFPSTGASGFTANPPAAATPPTTPSTYTNLATLSGTYNVGAGQPYTTLTAAVADYNTKCINGPIVFNLVDAVYPSETYPIRINNNAGASAVNTLTIRPDAAIAAPIAFRRSMNGTVNNEATLYLNGAKYVTIDGRPGGTGSNQYIIIEDSATTSAAAGNAILLANEASNNTLTYLDVRSGNANAANNSSTVPAAGSVPGAIAVLSTTGSAGNDNNIISFCNVHDTGTVAAAASLGVGIYMMNATTAGTAANNDNNTVTNCNIYDVFLASSNSAAINIAPGNNNWTISNNSVYQTATRTYTGTQTVRGFWITPNTGSSAGAFGNITGNFIGGTAPSCGGTAMTMTGATAWLYQGMDISTGNSGTTSIQGNTMNNINMTTTSISTTAMQGIGTANGTVNIGNITGNTFGNPAVNSAPYGITFTTTGSLGGITAIRVGGGSTGPHVVSNNIIAGIELKGDAALVAPSFGGILYTVGTTGTISSNTIGSATLPNSINLSSTSATSTSISLCRAIAANTSATNTTISNNLIANINSNYSGTGSGNTVTGIQVGTGAATVSGNTIRNLYSASQSTGGGTSAGIMGISYSSTTAPAVISGNTIFALKNTNPTTTAAVAVQAIPFAGPTSGNVVIEKNNIHSIALASPTNSAGIITGMDIASGTVLIKNNMIRLGLDSNGASITSPCTVRGITKNVAVAKIFHNSIYIGGTGVGTTATNTFAFVRTAAATTDSVINNIFVNNRSNATTGGKHYQVNLSSNATLVLNNNVYYGTGTGSVFGFNGTADVGGYTSGWVSGDVNSYVGDPMFINPTGNAATGDLHINPSVASVAEALGVALPVPVTDDIDNQVRSGLTPVDIGADAGNFTPVAFMSFVSATTTQTNTGTVANNSTNQQVIGIEVVTTGLVNPLVATTFNLNTNGTISTSDIANAKLFFTGNSSTFATTTQVGSPVASPSGAFSITGSQTLLSGTNYFWLTYDIPCAATPGNVIDAECTSVTIGSAQTPTVTAPAGTRAIVLGPLSGTKTVGGGGTPDFATLTAAMSAISSFGLGGNLTLNIMGNITEPAQVVIPKWTECGGSGFSLTIKPNTTATITGSVASGALIKINGASNVIIDGSNSGGTDRSLTITNTGTTSPTAVALASLGTALGASSNTIKNCNINTGVNSAIGYGIAVGGATPGTSGADNDNVTIQNNNITVATIGIYAVGTAAVSAGGDDNLSIIGNTIDYNGTLASLGIQVGNALSSSISQNTVSEFTSASQSPTGISLETGFINSTVTRNTITRAVTTNTGGYGGRGITVGTGTATSNLTIANNVIYGVNGTNWTAFGNSSSMGIAIGMVGNSSTITTTAGGINLYYNSVNMSGNFLGTSTTANKITAALYVGSGASALDIRNNIFVNSMFNTTAAAKAYAIYSAAPNTAFSNINYNDYDTAGTQGVLGFLGADQGTLAAWKTATAQDVNSIGGDPLFSSSTVLVPQLGSPVLAAGTPIAGITTDIAGITRSATTPSIGAYETAGDILAPVINYSLLLGTCTTGDRVLTATITDATGVPTSGTLVPRIYYKKNAGTYYSQPGTLASGTGLNGTWNFTIVAADMGGLVQGDAVSYYVVAQDVAAPVNIGSSPAGVVAVDVNTITTPPTPNVYSILGTLSGTYNVGAAQTYLTLTAAINAYNNACVTGPVTFLLTDAAYNETPPAINANPGASAVNTLTIKPATGVNTTVSGSVASGALIKLNGASYVTIDGSNNGSTSKNLTITNTNTTAPTAVSIISSGPGAGATNNTIKNCNISTGVATSTGYGIAVGGSTPGTTGADNDNTTIQNNAITLAPVGIYAAGTASVSAGGNDNLSIIGNSVDYNGALGSLGIQVGNGLNSSVSQNTISLQTSTTSAVTCISLETGFVSSSVTRNTITKAVSTNTGGYAGRGITVGTGTATSNLTIANNVITGINGSNWTTFDNSSSMGIAIGMVGNSTVITTTAGGINLYYNSVNLSGNYLGTSTTAAKVTAALYVGTGASALDIRNNVFVNSLFNPNAAAKAYAVYSAAANTAFSIINYNDYDTAGTQGVLGFLGADQGTLAAWKTATAQDVNSIGGDPLFTSSTVLVPQLGSPVLAAGTPIAGITTDIVGITRSATTPSIGAYETAGDISAPAITYSLLPGTCTTGDRVLTATITDATGVPTTGALVPRIYYKKNAGTYFSQPGTLASGTGLNGTWNFTIVAADMGGLLQGDAVSYYVVAQDVATPANIGSSPAGVIAVDVNTITTPPTPNVYNIQATLSGIYNVGTGNTYATLTAAVNAYNNSCLTGPVEFILTDPTYTEAGQMVINNPAYASAVNTLTIRPAVESSVTVSATVASGPVLKILSNYVIIDGNSGLAGNSLTIVNNGATSPNVVVIGSTGTTPITNITLRNTNFVNGTTTNSAVVISDGTTIGNAGYFNNINIVGDSIQKALIGVYAIAVVQAGNGSGLRIDSNLLNKSGANAIRNTGIYVQGVDGATVRYNQVGNFETATGEIDRGIWLALSSVNATIDRNQINNLGYTGTAGYAGHGIEVTSGVASAGVKITNNMIANMYGDGDSYTSTTLYIYNPMGIALNSSVAQGGIEIYNNSINLFGNTLNFTNAMSMGICLGYNSTANIRNNIIVNNLGLLSATGYGATGIFAGTANTQFTAINYNDYVVSATGGGANYIGQIATGGSSTLAAWQTASGGDANSLSIVPVFVSATDLHLVAASNCSLHRKGTPIAGLTKDFDNDTRDVNYPDMGADEFVAPLSGNLTWTGAVNSDWFNPFNWNCNEIPGPLSNVYIDGGKPNYPVVTGNVTIKSLHVNPSASFTMGTGFTLTLVP